MINDTIAGIATGLTESGISIIRISGPESIEVINRLFISPSNKRLVDSDNYYLNYGYICDSQGNIIDETLVSVMRKPNSYTREDVVEINCHGGILVTKKILNTILENNIRLSEPGEFTKRAFLNGRIDLSQAEAVMDIIGAESDLSLKASVNHLRGDLKSKIEDMRKSLLSSIAYIEAALDDPEHFSLEGLYNRLSEQINVQLQVCESLIASYNSGKIVKSGINTGIVGKPNAGKSSLLNALLGENRAIVTDIEGTTRDAITETINIGGINLNIIDTAGIRDTNDSIEKIGVDISYKTINESDLILFVCDSSKELDDNDFNIIDHIKDKKVIVIYNKTDIGNIVDINIFKKLFANNNIPVVQVSARSGVGIDSLKSIIYDIFSIGDITSNNEVLITSLRQKNCLLAAKKAYQLVIEGINNMMPEDMLTIDMYDAYEQLGLVIGESIDDDLANEIFSKFCMGK